MSAATRSASHETIEGMGASRRILKKSIADARRHVSIREALRKSKRSRKRIQRESVEFWSSGLGKTIYYGIIVAAVAAFAIRIGRNRSEAVEIAAR